jgi:uncharacterized LabA/DUF88 family protein
MMEKEKVVVFLDYANINRAAREKRYRLDYDHLLHYAGEGRFLLDAHCYVPINPRNEHRLDGVIEELWSAGYLVTTKLGRIVGGTYKCNFDVEITLDVLKVVYQVKPDIIVLATGDADFVPLILEVRKAGVRVEVAAFEEAIGTDLLLKCSGFISLAVYYESYLAAQNGELDEERMTEPYQDLIQSQNGVSEEEVIASMAEPDQDLLQPHDSDLHEDDVEQTTGSVDERIDVLPSEILDESGL